MNLPVSRWAARICVAAVVAGSLTACAPEPVEHTTSPDASWQSRAQAAIAAGEYAPHPDGSSFRATNRAQDFRVVFDAGGVAIHPRTGAGEVRVSLVAWGRDGALAEVEPSIPGEGPCLVGMWDAFGECLHRIQAERPGLVEWWENRPDGLEHGFVVTPDEGDGALVFELAVTGAEVELDGDAAVLRRQGAALRYSGPVAWDETGRELPAWLEEGAGLRIVVDDAGAIGAITVDPLLTTSAWSAEGDVSMATFGYSVASAGDVNGDGYGDVIVGSHYYTNGTTYEGAAFVFHGSSAGLSTTAAWSAESNQASSQFGASVASAGDVNGDGFADVVVGAPRYQGTYTLEGGAWVYLGSSAGLAATAAWSAVGGQSDALFGSSVASAGDVNGDGYADVVVGAPYYGAGHAYVYLGSATGLATTAAWIVEADRGTAAFGGSVAAADVDGDGYSDVVVGASRYENGSRYEGRAYLYRGSASGLGTTADWVTESDEPFAYYGASVASAGDVNGDGYGDVLVGAYYYGATHRGQAYLYLGSSSGLATSADWTAGSDQDLAYFGASVAPAGDINGDGYADVVIGAWGYDNGSLDEGISMLYLGSADGLASDPAWSAESDQDYARFGWSGGAAGDVNGDGYGDLVVGAYAYTNDMSTEGKAWVYLGSPSGLSDTPPNTFDGGQASAELGFAVSGAGDVNGDGFADVAIGAPLYDNGETDEGAAFVYLGSSDGPEATAAWSGEGDHAGAGFGWSLGSGDFDGDGFADLVVGAPLYDNGETDEGQVRVFSGSTSGLATTASWTTESDQAGAEYGHAVAGAGDVDADGYDEVLVGARYYDNGSTDEGRAYLFEGASTGPSTTASWTAESDQASAVFGFSVASAHDVDGDGYGDVIIGALGWNNGSTDEGRAYVFHGSASGLATTATWTVESDTPTRSSDTRWPPPGT